MKKKIDKRVCPKCFEVRKLTEHHILPRRFYKFNKHVIYLCRKCHDNIEVIISKLESENNGRLDTDGYYKVIKDFIKNGMYASVMQDFEGNEKILINYRGGQDETTG